MDLNLEGLFEEMKGLGWWRLSERFRGLSRRVGGSSCRVALWKVFGALLYLLLPHRTPSNQNLPLNPWWSRTNQTTDCHYFSNYKTKIQFHFADWKYATWKVRSIHRGFLKVWQKCRRHWIILKGAKKLAGSKLIGLFANQGLIAGWVECRN